MNATEKTRQITARRNWITALALLCLLVPTAAHAACTSPAGNAGDLFYSSTSTLMAYCNGTNWVNVGSTGEFGTLTTNDFCLATSAAQVGCTTAQISLTSQVSGILPAANGGTGVANSSTITLAGNVSTAGTLTTSGAFGQTYTLTGTTNVTLPASGTLVNTGVTTLSSLVGVGTITSGTWHGTGLTVPYGGTGAISLTAHGVLIGNAGSAIQVLGVGATGTILIGNTGANPSFSASPSITSLTLSGAEIITPGTAYTTTGSQNNVALGSFSTIRYTGAGTATFTGIVAGSSGQILYLHNTSASTLTLSNLSASSSAANQIVTGTGSDFVMAANSSVRLQYDGVASLWRIIGGSGSSIASNPAGSAGQIQYDSSLGAFAASANLFWDNVNNFLGIGTSTPVQPLTVAGNIDVITSAYIVEIANAASTGTTVNKLAKINTSAAAVVSAAADVDGAIGIVVGGAGTSGSAQIAISGQASCVFDGATTAGHFVTISASVAGDCTDAGASRSTRKQTIGRVLSTNGAGGTYKVALRFSTPDYTCAAGTTTVFLTSGSLWTVPICWNNSNNSIEVIGGGGGSGTGSVGQGGGGGGAYAKSTNVTLSAATSVNYAVGAGGAGGAAGGDSWICNGVFNCASIAGSAVQVGAKGGSTGSGNTGGAGGVGTSGVGATKNSGGAGGTGASTSAGAGGGGAGGAGGVGGAGGASPNTTPWTGSGGGGADGGGIGTAGGGGAGTGGAGANSGGAGGAGVSSSGSPGNPGGAGAEWTTAGSGGGGGGGAAVGKGTGGTGGLYGGGAGGGGGSGGASGVGAQGIIVIKYTN